MIKSNHVDIINRCKNYRYYVSDDIIISPNIFLNKITSLSTGQIIKISDDWVPKFDGYIKIVVSLNVGSNNTPSIGIFGDKISEYQTMNNYYYPNLIDKMVGHIEGGVSSFYGAMVSDNSISNYTTNSVNKTWSTIFHVNRGYPVFLYLKIGTNNGASVNTSVKSITFFGNTKEI